MSEPKEQSSSYKSRINSRAMQKIQPPEQLYSRIIEQIRREKLLQIKRRIIFFGSALMLSFVGFIAAAAHLFQDVNTSGFLQLLSLTATDFRIVSANFSDYLLSLIEAFPILSAGLLCGILLILAVIVYKFHKHTMEFRNFEAHQ